MMSRNELCNKICVKLGIHQMSTYQTNVPDKRLEICVISSDYELLKIAEVCFTDDNHIKEIYLRKNEVTQIDLEMIYNDAPLSVVDCRGEVIKNEMELSTDLTGIFSGIQVDLI